MRYDIGNTTIRLPANEANWLRQTLAKVMAKPRKEISPLFFLESSPLAIALAVIVGCLVARDAPVTKSVTNAIA
ncbi:hypothetical protein D3C87_1869070 [compost metagenome]